SGNGSVASTKRVGTLSGDTVTDTLYAEQSATGTNPLPDSVAPVCGGTATTNSHDAFYSFHLQKPTHLNLSPQGRTGTTSGNEAYNPPGLANEAYGAVTPPASLPQTPLINGFVADHNGGDTHEFVEVFGQPSTSYNAYSILEIEGDAGSGGGGI